MKTWVLLLLVLLAGCGRYVTQQVPITVLAEKDLWCFGNEQEEECQDKFVQVNATRVIYEKRFLRLHQLVLHLQQSWSSPCAADWKSSTSWFTIWSTT